MRGTKTTLLPSSSAARGGFNMNRLTALGSAVRSATSIVHDITKTAPSQANAAFDPNVTLDPNDEKMLADDTVGIPPADKSASPEEAEARQTGATDSSPSTSSKRPKATGSSNADGPANSDGSTDSHGPESSRDATESKSQQDSGSTTDSNGSPDGSSGSGGSKKPAKYMRLGQGESAIPAGGFVSGGH